ncbi:MAG: Ig-like domain-containing protein [Oscillospiraceae bacterium]|nr:Ig-like domain-containing protein [Oscillospiraceae bacterium]
MVYDYNGNVLNIPASGYDWTGRVMSANGDSHVGNATADFYGYVEEQLGVRMARLAMGGIAVAPDKPGSDYDFRRRVSDIPADVDLIYVMGDSNAEFATDLDHMDSYDITTWGGRWNTTVAAIKRSFPQVPVILASDYPHKRTDFDPTIHAHYQFERLAVRFGCYHISVGRDVGFSRINTTRVWGLYDGDTTGHCSNEAMKIWADCVLQKIRSIKPPVWAGTDTISIDATASVAVDGTASIGYDITGDQSIRWTSDDEDVACVMGGVVYGMAAGTATITATTRNGNTASCTVTVTEATE